MDLGLSEEQEMLRQFARDFLEKECPESHVRDMEEDDRGYSQELWAKMAEQGWMGLVVPEAYGGVGMGYLDLIILVEEVGRALVPGRQVWTLAFTEPSPRFDAAGVRLAAQRDPSTSLRVGGDGYVLNGTKLFIRDSHVADKLVVVARTGPSTLRPGSGQASAEDGVSLFAVDAGAAGVRHTPVRTIASDKQNEVRFENVRVPASTAN